jgi:uncharacterized protein YfcZ (UPF0381/DUF406 family)
LYDFDELTQEQKTKLQAVVDKYADVEGDYEPTMLQGIAHGYCDSGIITDGYSVECAERVSTYFTEQAQAAGYLELFNAFIKEVEGEELLCCKVIAEIADIGDIELCSAYIWELLD